MHLDLVTYHYQRHDPVEKNGEKKTHKALYSILQYFKLGLMH